MRVIVSAIIEVSLSMGEIRILANGSTPQAQATARGKLFEQLMALVLRQMGFTIDKIASANYAGMEIDIEGKQVLTGIPVYAECKCYENRIGSKEIQAFFGKYAAFWFENRKSQGLIFAIPGLNTHAKTFYKERCEKNQEITVRLLEEEQILNAIVSSGAVTSYKVIEDKIRPELGTLGDWTLVYHDTGFYWIQYLIPMGGGIAKDVAFFTADGNELTDEAVRNNIIELFPELADFNLVSLQRDVRSSVHRAVSDHDVPVEVRGSSSYFEYQFPSSPEFFVGRVDALSNFSEFASQVLARSISSRGILFEANSGWGKSSLVLACVSQLRQSGHFAFAIDSRSASSSQFILQVVEYVLSRVASLAPDEWELNQLLPVSGFDGAVEALIKAGEILRENGKLLVIFLDQFENVFFLHDALRRIRDTLLRLCDSGTNVVLGFSWKADLIGTTSEFPFQYRDDIIRFSRRIILDKFSDVETSALLIKLASELRSQLRKDLKFLLSEYSQGYPWLLKKLCAHVKYLYSKGVLQADIANSLLNIQELFQEDLRGLSAEEEDTLRRIARLAPISYRDLGEEFKPEIVQRLVDARLVVRVANKFDIYWDIFRDYLNTGLLPAQENYILRVQPASVFNVVLLIAENDNCITVSQLRSSTGMSLASFYNIMREMRLLGLAFLNEDKVSLLISYSRDIRDLENSVKIHLRERLKRNRLVIKILDSVDAQRSLSIDEIATLLAGSSPYVSATEATWRFYARAMCDWMSAGGLVYFDKKRNQVIDIRDPGELKPGMISKLADREGMTLPQVQFAPTSRVLKRIAENLGADNSVDLNDISWSDLSTSTYKKAIATLETIGVIKRIKNLVVVSRDVKDRAIDDNSRISLLREAVKNMESFEIFLNVLNAHQEKGLSLSNLAIEYRDALGADWTEGTAVYNTKIVLEWARQTDYAPPSFASRRQGKSNESK